MDRSTTRHSDCTGRASDCWTSGLCRSSRWLSTRRMTRSAMVSQQPGRTPVLIMSYESQCRYCRGRLSSRLGSGATIVGYASRAVIFGDSPASWLPFAAIMQGAWGPSCGTSGRWSAQREYPWTPSLSCRARRSRKRNGLCRLKRFCFYRSSLSYSETLQYQQFAFDGSAVKLFLRLYHLEGA